MSEEEKEILKFFENKEYSFTCEVPKKELYEALEIEETDFETEVIRINTLINLIKKQQKEIKKLKERQDYARLEKEQLLEDGISKDKIREIKNKNIGQYMNFYREIEKLVEK